MKTYNVLIGASVFFFSSLANAGLIGVTDIVIKNSLPSYLQVSEVVATESITGQDLALLTEGASTSFLSYGWGGIGDYAINGYGPNGHWEAPGYEYHSAGASASEFLKITLAAVSELDEITIMGRTDCCSSRDVYDLFVYGETGNLLFEAYDLSANNADHSVTVSFDVPEPSVLALFGAGILGLGLIRRRKLHQS